MSSAAGSPAQRRVPPRPGRLDGRPPRREGRADERLDLPRRRARDAVQPVADDDALPALQHRALPRARRLRDRRELAAGVEPGELARAASAAPAGRAASGSTPRSIGPDEALRLMPATSSESLYGAVWISGDGHLDPHIATHARGRSRARARRAHPDRHPRYRVRAVRDARSRAVLTGSGPHRDGVRRQRRRHVGAAGRGDGRRLHACSIPGRPPAHRAEGGRRGRAAARHAVLPRPGQPRLRQGESGGMVFGGYEPNPVSRWEDGVPWEHAARSLPPDYGALRAADGRARSGASRSSPTPRRSASSAIRTR